MAIHGFSKFLLFEKTVIYKIIIFVSGLYGTSLIQAGDGTVFPTPTDLQPAPLVGDEGTAPNSAVRFDLAERGFRYAIVVDRDSAAAMVEQISRLGQKAGLVSAHVSPRHGQFVLDAWQAWQSRDATKVATRLIIPIACDP